MVTNTTKESDTDSTVNPLEGLEGAEAYPDIKYMVQTNQSFSFS